MSLKTTLFPLAITLLVLMSGCKPKVEGETTSWKENQKKATDFKAKYPAFAASLDQSFTNASKIWDDAAKITKEEEKAAKMREANDEYGKLLSPMTSYESNVESANSSQKKAQGKKYPSSVWKQVSSDMSEAYDKLEGSINKFHDAQPATLEEAIKDATEASDLASDARSKYDAVIRKASKK
ncbi:MAG: hypothetical protein JWO03_2809 [Bacteroidetes bacterium]|nr:hypothetical protein [Bacteroidota bacterium]